MKPDYDLIWKKNMGETLAFHAIHIHTHPSVFSLKNSKMSIASYYWCCEVNLNQKAGDISRNIYCNYDLEIDA